MKEGGLSSLFVIFNNNHLSYLTCLDIRFLTLIHICRVVSRGCWYTERHDTDLYGPPSVLTSWMGSMGLPPEYANTCLSAGWLQSVGYNSVEVRFSRKYLRKIGWSSFFECWLSSWHSRLCILFILLVKPHSDFSQEDTVFCHLSGDETNNWKTRKILRPQINYHLQNVQTPE